MIGGMVAYVAWRFWLGALNKKGGQGQRNREEIGAGASPLVRGRFARVFGALPLSRTPDKTAMLRRLGDWTHS